MANDHGRTWEYARLAGDRARDAYANVEAVAHYEQALVASRHMGAAAESERAEVWEALATVRDNAGQLEAADAAYRSALRLVPADSPRAGWLFERRAWVSQRRGDTPRAIRLVRRGVRLLDASPAIEARRFRARLLAREAVIRRQQGRSTEAMHLTRVAIAEATASGDRMTLARSYLTWDWCLLELGRLDEAVHAQNALEIYAALGELRERAGALNNLGAVAYWAGDWDTAIDLYGQAAESARQCGGLADAAMFEANIAEVYVNQRRLDEAERLLHSSMRLSRAAGSEGQRAFETLQLGRIATARGHNADAIALLGQAAALRDGAGEARDAARALLYLALVYADTSRLDEAEDILVAVGPHIGDTHRGPMGALFDRVRATVLAERGDRDGATEVIRRAVGDARADGLLYELTTVLALAHRLNMPHDVASAAELEELSDRLGISRPL
jgi:tetratricopeptide (TPR) repeat protein